MEDEFVKHAMAYGKDGELWLKNIPEKIKEFEQKWDIKVSPPFKLTYNYVAPAERKDGTKVVIKMGFPQEREFQTEIDALEKFNGEGIERILEADRASGVILIERLFPGMPLSKTTDDEKRTRIIASVIRKLHKPAPENHNFITVSEWTKDLFQVRNWYNGTTGPLPEYLVDKAQALFNELIATQDTPVLVHGDLHHDNVLSSKRGEWLAIDPKGIIAEPCYETVALLRNPYPAILQYSDLGKILKCRIQILEEELGFSAVRIQKWGVAQTMLAAVWSIDKNNKGWESGVAIAQVLDKIKF